MLNKILILTIFLFCLSLSPSTAQWQKLQAPDGYEVNDVFIFEGVACSLNTNIPYCSVNSGDHWNPQFQVGAPVSNYWVYNMLLYDNVWYVCCANGFYYSQDNGITWKSYSILKDIFVIYFHRNGNNLFAFSAYNQVFYSSDNGINWNFKTSDELKYMSSFVEDSSHLLAYLKYPWASSDYMERSDNNGTDWISISNKLPGNTLIKDLFLINSKLYLLSQSNLIYRSDDYGDTWTLIFDNKDDLIINSIVSFKERLVVSTSKGIIYTDDEAVTWVSSSLENPFKAEFTKLASDSENLFGITAKYGIYKIDFLLDTVTSCNNGLPHSVNRIQLLSHKNKLYRISDNNLLISENNGIDWRASEYVFPSLNLMSFENFLLSLKGNILYISFDEGENWDAISSNLASGSKIYSFGDKIWIDQGAEYGLYYSPDLGQTWQLFSPTQGVFQILYLTYANDKLYFFSNNMLFISGDDGETSNYKNYPNDNFLTNNVKYYTLKQGNDYLTFALDSYNNFFALSKDLGDSWKNIIIPTKEALHLPMISVGSWIILTLGNSDYDKDGMFQCVIGSNDNGENWVNISDGIQEGSRIQSNVIEQNGFLFACDSYGNIWTRPASDLDQLGVSDQPAKDKSTIFLDLFPNPGKGLITITLQEVIRGTFEIYTLEGKLEYSSKNAEDFLNKRIDLSFLNKGFHLVKITTKDKYYVGKFFHY